MSDYTRTPNYQLYKPTPDADEDAWGGHLNANADALDGLISSLTQGNLVYTATGATTPRAAQDRAVEHISVKDFGAIGDGTTNDASAFQAALATSAAGGCIFVPAGTYNIGSALPQAITGAVTFEGAGSGTTILNFSAATDGIAFSLSPAANVHVRGMTIARTVAGAAYANTGLSVVTPADQGTAPRLGLITIEDLVLKGNASRSTAWATGVNLNNTNTVRVNTVMVLMPNASGAGTGVGIAHAGQSTTSYAADTVFSNVTVQGGGIGLSIGDWVQGVYVVNSQFIAVDYGIRWPGVAGHSDIALFVANTHINASTRGVYVQYGGAVQIVNTLVLHWTTASVTGNWAAFEIIGYNSAMLSNNSMSGWTSFSGTENAILVNASNFCTIIGNAISGVKNDAIVLLSSTFNTTVTCNNAVNMGSGAKLLSDTSGNATNQNLLNQIGGILDLTMNATGTAIYSGAATGTVGLGTNTQAFANLFCVNTQASGASLVGTASAAGTVIVQGPNATTREVQYFTGAFSGANLRWGLGVTGNSEGGSNSGSDFHIRSIGDTGTQVGVPLAISRATGNLSLGFQLLFAGTLPANAANDAAASAAGVPIGGVYRNGSVMMVRTA